MKFSKLIPIVNLMTNIFIILSFLGYFAYADTNGVFFESEDIVPGIFGEDEIAGNYTFNDPIYFNSQFCLNGVCILDYSDFCQNSVSPKLLKNNKF